MKQNVFLSPRLNMLPQCCTLTWINHMQITTRDQPNRLWRSIGSHRRNQRVDHKVNHVGGFCLLAMGQQQGVRDGRGAGGLCFKSDARFISPWKTERINGKRGSGKAPAPALGAVTQLCPLITATAREHCLARDAAVHRATQWEPLIKPRQCALEPAGRVWRKESDKRKGLKERATGETC